MSKNIYYRILAWAGIVLLSAFAVLLAVYFGTRQQVFLFLATGTGGIGLIIWLFLYMQRKGLEKREEMEKQFREFEENKKREAEKKNNPEIENNDAGKVVSQNDGNPPANKE